MECQQTLVVAAKESVRSILFSGEPNNKRKLYENLKIVLLVAVIEQCIDPLIRQIPSLPHSIYRLLRFMYQMSSRFRDKTVKRSAKVPRITEGNQISNLFEAVEWCVNKKIEETDIKDRGEITLYTKVSTDGEVVSSLPEQREIKFFFEGYLIYASSSSAVIPIHADREYKRKNNYIEIWVYQKESDTTDVLHRFIQSCDKQYVKQRTAYFNTPSVYISQRKKKSIEDDIDDLSGVHWVKTEAKIRRKVGTIVLQDGLRDEIMDDINTFIASEEWYSERGEAHTRRYLFFGPPGTGKSSLINAIAATLHRSIYHLNLAVVHTDQEYMELMKSVPFSKAIVVIEDIDRSNKILLKQEEQQKLEKKEESTEEEKKKSERESKKPTSTLTLSFILNALDGSMVDNDGQIMIMTSNHPERIDEAMLRGRRVDRRFEFGLCTREQAVDLFKNFFPDTGNEEELSLPPDWPKSKRVCPADLVSAFLEHKSDPPKALSWLKER